MRKYPLSRMRDNRCEKNSVCKKKGLPVKNGAPVTILTQGTGTSRATFFFVLGESTERSKIESVKTARSEPVAAGDSAC
jgi:hypothetical protein